MTVTATRALQLQVVRRRVSTGLDVVIRRDPGLGFVVLHHRHAVGSVDDPAGRSGLAHLAEHVVCGAGGGATPRLGSANANTGFEHTGYVASGPPDALPTLVVSAAERLAVAAATVDPGDLHRHAQVVTEEIRERQEPARFGSGLRRSLRLLFGPSHPLGRAPMGDPADLAQIGAEEVRDVIGHRYAGARTVVTVAGPVDPVEAIDRIARAFGPLRSAGPLSPPTQVGAPILADTPRREDVDEGQPTALLRYTFALPPVGSPAADVAAGEVAMGLLTAAPWATLGPVAREYRILGVAARHARSGAGPSLGFLKLACPAEVPLDEVDAAVTGCLRRLARGDLREDVLAASRARCVKERLLILSRARTCAEELAAQEMWYADGASEPAAAVDALRAVTVDDVAEIAATGFAAPAVVAYHAAGAGGAA